MCWSTRNNLRVIEGKLLLTLTGKIIMRMIIRVHSFCLFWKRKTKFKYFNEYNCILEVEYNILIL